MAANLVDDDAKKASGQTPASIVFCKTAIFSAMHFELEFYSISSKTELKFCSNFAWLILEFYA